MCVWGGGGGRGLTVVMYEQRGLLNISSHMCCNGPELNKIFN